MGEVNFECIVVSLRVDFVIFMFVCCTDPLVNNSCLIDCFPLCVFLIVMCIFKLLSGWWFWLYQTTVIFYFLNFFVTSSILLHQVVKGFNQSGNSSILDLAFVSSPSLLNFCNNILPLSTSDPMALFLPFFLMLYPGDLPAAHAELYGARLKQTSIWSVTFLQTDWNSLYSEVQDVNQFWTAW